jgi:L-asparaginase
VSGKRVLIVYTGGTVGMRRGPNGWEPAPGYLQQQMKLTPAFQHPAMPEYDVFEFEPLLDSSDLGPAEWLAIARRLRDDFRRYDGFVVVHGTDTMAYTASALAFMLEDLDKPVILTGSQMALCEPRSDAQQNLVTSLRLAADYPIPEVCVFFDSALFRGCRTVKVNCDGFDAFASPNCGPLGTAGIDIDVDWQRVRRPPPRPPGGGLTVHERLDTHVGVLWIFPGITGAIVGNLLAPPLKAVVLLAFGLGNGPVNDREFVAALKEADERGVVIVDCTQCLIGSVDVSGYRTGLGRHGAVSGYDMTPEAALAKLFYLFGKGCSPAEVKARIGVDLRGELTPPGAGAGPQG